MPYYLYKCPECGEEFSEQRKMEERDLDMFCWSCDDEVKTVRQITVPYLTTEPRHLSEGNKRGYAENDARRKADDKKYNKRWDKRMPSLTE
jgi:putative FmdB family regulatory protein